MRIRASALLVAITIVVASAPAFSQSFADVVQATQASVAFVLATGDEQVSGSAFVVDPGGVLVTALHVIADAREVSVLLPGGLPEPTNVLAVNIPHDLAVLKISKSGLPALRLADSNAPKVGAEVIVLGYPLAKTFGPSDVTFTATRGIVSALRPDYVQVDASMNPGVSGGPVLDTQGQVIGVADRGFRPAVAQNVNFAVPVSAVSELVTKVLNSAETPSPLALPLTVVQQTQIRYDSGGLGGGGHRRELGISCTPPPPNATMLVAVEADSSAPRALVVKTWLSLGAGASAGSPDTFGYVGSERPPVERLNLPAGTVCLNYEAINTINSGLAFFFGLTFSVNYTLSYRVFPPNIAH
jgi:S1-C subfamily serine protease